MLTPEQKAELAKMCGLEQSYEHYSGKNDLLIDCCEWLDPTQMTYERDILMVLEALVEKLKTTYPHYKHELAWEEAFGLLLLGVTHGHKFSGDITQAALEVLKGGSK